MISMPAVSTTRALLLPAVTALLAAPPAPLSAQSAADILQRSVELYEERMEGIENYTVVQRMEDGPALPMGAGTTYFERTMVDGRPVFVVRNAAMDSIMAMQQQSGAMEDPGSMMAKLMDRATLRGEEAVDGHDTWIIHVDDAGDLDWGAAMGEGSASFTVRTLTLAIDQEDYVVRRMSVEGDMEREGQTAHVTIVSTMGDYRNVEGMLHPFRTEMRMSGLTSGSMTPEERAELRQQMAQAREQLAQMPEAQRAMAERMMGGQLEKMEEMLAEGTFTVVMVVDEIKVNAGPPSGG